MTDSLNLIASSAYGKVLSQQVTKSPENFTPKTIQLESSDFQKLVNVKFNNYANLSPNEILNKISLSRNTPTSSDEAVSVNISKSVASELKNAREVLTKQELMSQKAAIGQANIVELMATSTQAKALLSTIVAVKDEAKSAWEKIWGMSI